MTEGNLSAICVDYSTFSLLVRSREKGKGKWEKSFASVIAVHGGLKVRGVNSPCNGGDDDD